MKLLIVLLILLGVIPSGYVIRLRNRVAAQQTEKARSSQTMRLNSLIKRELTKSQRFSDPFGAALWFAHNLKSPAVIAKQGETITVAYDGKIKTFRPETERAKAQRLAESITFESIDYPRF